MKKENLRPEDLMVGDWFRFRYTIDGKEIVHTFRISRIENELGDYYVWGERSGVLGRMCYPERLEPIPLTPEILEKNGFQYSPIGFWFLKIGFVSVRIEYTDKWLIEIHNMLQKKDEKGRSDLVSYCRDWAKNVYVHDLQHALQLCGIDKPIVL